MLNAEERPEFPEGYERPAWAIEFDEGVDRMWEIAHEIERNRLREAAEAEYELTPAERLLPNPLQGVIHYLAKFPVAERPEWVSTAELAAIVLGPDVENGATKLGQGLRRNAPALKSTEPRDMPDGSRARGYLVEDLFRAAVAIRDGDTG